MKIFPLFFTQENNVLVHSRKSFDCTVEPLDQGKDD